MEEDGDDKYEGDEKYENEFDEADVHMLCLCWIGRAAS